LIPDTGMNSDAQKSLRVSLQTIPLALHMHAHFDIPFDMARLICCFLFVSSFFVLKIFSKTKSPAFRRGCNSFWLIKLFQWNARPAKVVAHRTKTI
jgi:hypothetical protein